MIDEATAAVREAQARDRAEERRKYAHPRHMRACDWVLGQLEELNQDGIEEVPDVLRRRIRRALRRLPASCLEPLALGSVQGTLDSVFEVQARLLHQAHPWWPVDDGGEDTEPVPVPEPAPPPQSPSEATCVWLAAQRGGVRTEDVPEDLRPMLRTLNGRLVYQVRGRWYARLDWRSRLAIGRAS